MHTLTLVLTLASLAAAIASLRNVFRYKKVFDRFGYLVIGVVLLAIFGLYLLPLLPYAWEGTLFEIGL